MRTMLGLFMLPFALRGALPAMEPPAEKPNLAASRPALAAEMEKAYLAWFREATAPSGGKVGRFPVTLTGSTDLLIPNATRLGGAELFGKGWDYDWASFPTPAAALEWSLVLPRQGRYAISVLHTAKSIGGEVRVSAGGSEVRAQITTVYDPPGIPRRDLVPRWEVPDKVFRPLSLGTITLPAGEYRLKITAATGIEAQAVRLQHLE